MRRFGLIGYPLGHSFSREYFTRKFQDEGIRDCIYENYPLSSINEFPELVRAQRDLCGLNVTIPYKEEVIPYLDALDDTAAAVGAVNTIRFAGGRLIGCNTDVYGFRKSLEPMIKSVLKPGSAIKAFILGTGGSSKAVAYVLDELGIAYRYVSRQGGGTSVSYNSITESAIRAHQLIVNTTPLGMYPDVESKPELPYGGIGPEHILFDLVYNPELTRFLEEGKKRGAAAKNGLEMLKFQADRSWAIWNDL